jgi:hypothetical protein
MGCFHSVPQAKRTHAAQPYAPIPSASVEEEGVVAIQLDTVPDRLMSAKVPQTEERHSPGRDEYVDAKEVYSAAASLSVSMCSEDPHYVSSAAAVHSSSSLDDSIDDGMDNPSTPGPTVSPNPGSPNRDNVPHSTLALAILNAPEEIVVSRAGPPSRLQQVAELTNTVLCIQVLNIWRCEVLRRKIAESGTRLVSVGEASRLILEENESLKRELETARSRKPPILIDTSTQAEELPPVFATSVTSFTSPPRRFNDPSNSVLGFMSLPSSRSTPMTLPPHISIATPRSEQREVSVPNSDPMYDSRRSWGDFSWKAPESPPEKMSPADRLQKLRRLSDSIKPFELSNRQ